MHKHLFLNTVPNMHLLLWLGEYSEKIGLICFFLVTVIPQKPTINSP